MADEWYYVGGAILLFLASQIYLVKRRWDELEKFADVLSRARRSQWRRLRRIGKQSLKLRRDRRQAESQMERLTDSINRLNRMLQVTQSKEVSRTYVLDDRRTPRDVSYVVTVRHQKFAMVVPEAPEETVLSWQTGRRFIVWAVDEERALAKVEQRMPAARGYQILGIALEEIEEEEKRPSAGK